VAFIYNEILFSCKEDINLLFAGQWIELESIILSEVTQVKKAEGLMCSLICGI
jgi:hypothetical protein